MKRVVLFMLLGVVACAPALQGVSGRDAVAVSADLATLELVQGGVRFSPGPAPALGVLVYIGGSNLTTTSSECRAFGNGIACFYDTDGADLSQPVTLLVEGQDLSANASFYRPGNPVPIPLAVRERE